jgi:hypothetical protein
MVIMTVQAVPRLIEEQGLVLERYCDAVDGLGFGMTKSMVKVQAYSLLEEAYLKYDDIPKWENTGQDAGWHAMGGTKGHKLRSWRCRGGMPASSDYIGESAVSIGVELMVLWGIRFRV